MADATKIIETDLKEDAGFNMGEQIDPPNEVGMWHDVRIFFVHINAQSLYPPFLLTNISLNGLSCIDC